jgi:hypothetical protein
MKAGKQEASFQPKEHDGNRPEQNRPHADTRADAIQPDAAIRKQQEGEQKQDSAELKSTAKGQSIKMGNVGRRKRQYSESDQAPTEDRLASSGIRRTFA